MKPFLSVFVLTVALAGLGTVPSRALAQGGTLSGVVVDDATLRPVADADVGVEGTALRTRTDGAGRFRLTGVPSGQVTIAVRALGYRPVVRVVNADAGELRLALARAAVELDAVVVTGTPAATEQRALGNAVATINAGEVTQNTQVNSLQELLNGRAAGVVVQSATGMVGTGSRIRVRGASSFSLRNEPLVYVNGVRVNNDAATGPTNQAFGSSTISRFNDLNPDDIESIEILKGPAAATLYGTEASNGVIQIITKRGKVGAPRWNLSVKQGINFLANPEGRFPVNYQVVAGDTVTLDIVEREDSLGHPIWRTGHLQQYDLNVAGGSDLVTYYAAGGYETSEGADASNDLQRYHSRLNVSVRPSARFGVSADLGTITGRTNLACEAGCGGRVWGTILANPQNLVGTNASRRGFHSGTPEQYDLLENYWQDLDRVTASFQVNHDPVPWLTHRMTVGTDRTREENVSFTPRVDSLIGHPVWSSAPLGSKAVTDREVAMTTVDYAATATARLAGDVVSRLSVGGQYYRRATDSVRASGSVFPAPGLTAVNATTIDRFNAQDFVEEKSLGFFAQEQISWRDRLYVTAGLRSDDHSAFGANFDRVYYPKVSASWVVSDEPFWRFGAVSLLRLRAAYGESGQQPQNFASLRTYLPVTGPGDGAAVTPEFIGNPDLGPERGKEIELGFDAAFLDDRAGLEFTFYHKRTADAILEREIAPSIGFSGFQFFNAGAVRNTGVEMLVRGRPYDGANVAVDLSFSLATNANNVLNLGDTGLTFVTAGTALRHQVGHPIGAWFEQRVVSAEFDALGNTINVMCDSLGLAIMPCRGADGTFGTDDDAPNVYLGRTSPSLEGAFTAGVSFAGRLRLYALVDFKYGYRKIDGNTRVRCAFFGGRCRENFYPQEFDPRRIAAIRSSNNLIDYLIVDGGFTKLREVSVSYTLPAAVARAVNAASATVQVAGRNLYTWTAYTSLEPEAFFLGGGRGGGFSIWDQTTLPQLTQWVLTLNLGF